MTFFLTINPGYKYFEIGLYQNNLLIDSLREDNKRISKELIMNISSLLEKHAITIDDLDSIIANQGPAPFTSLRAILTTINGISFIKKIKLIGVNGLTAFLDQEKKTFPEKNIVILLNAFCQDVYFAFEVNKGITYGSKNIHEFLNTLSTSYAKEDEIVFIGNGAELYQDTIKKEFPQSSIYNHELNLNSIFLEGLTLKNEPTKTELMPLYFKEYSL